MLVAGGVALYFGQETGSATATRYLTPAVVDGDTLRMGGRRIRLIGIDAPEMSQTCSDENGLPWLCGAAAHAQLRSLVGFGLVECKSSSVDRYGRPLATCSAGKVSDLGEAMVRAGYAVSFMSWKYWLAEQDARTHKRGMWRGTFISPQAWRAGDRGAS